MGPYLSGRSLHPFGFPAFGTDHCAAILRNRQILEKKSVTWSASNGTITIDQPSYHAAMFIHGSRAIHGVPVTSGEYAGLNFFENSVKPVLEAQIDYADSQDFKALGTQVMTGMLNGYALFSNHDGTQCQFPGNEENQMPVYGLTTYGGLARATGPHAWFVPLARWRLLSSSQVDWLFSRSAEYEDGFFHSGSFILLGWEAAIPWRPDDTKYAWVGNGRTNYSDYGRPYEALNSAYTVLSIFDALNPNKPLASYSVEAERMKHLAKYFGDYRPVYPKSA